MKTRKRILATVLVLLMMLTSMPLTSFADIKLLGIKSIAASYTGGDYWLWPCTRQYMSCEWWDNIYHDENHRGIDISIGIGSNVYASRSGKVHIFKGMNSKRGYWMVIDHGDGFYSEYQHLNGVFCVKSGTYVNQGDVIAKSGNTGKGTGPHLHFEIMNLGKTGLASKYGSYYNDKSKFINVNPQKPTSCNMKTKTSNGRFVKSFSDEKGIQYLYLENGKYYIYNRNGEKSLFVALLSNSKITAKNLKIPLNVKQGKTFDFSGTVSTNSASPSFNAGVVIYDASASRRINLPLQESNSEITNRSSQKSLSFSSIAKSLNLSRLSAGKYRMVVYASTRSVSARELNDQNAFIDLLQKNDDLLLIYNNTFEVKSVSKSPLKVKALASSVSSSKTYTDGNGNQYFLFNGTFSNSTSESSKGSSSSSGNSSTYYNSKARYSVGNYKVTAKVGLNTRKLPSATSAKIKALEYGTTIAVTATDGNWGYTSKGWICLDYATRVSPLQTQTYSTVNYDTGKYKVIAHDGLKIRSGAGTNYSQLDGLKYGAEFIVNKVDGSWGYSDSLKGWLCLSYAAYVKEPDVPPLPVPSTPNLSSVTSSEVAVGDLISVTWASVADADCYTASLIDASSKKILETKERITNTEVNFATPYAGTFDVSVVAVNSQQKSAAGYINGITAKTPSTVTFKDWDGTVISTQEVAYGRDATIPQFPSRTGYTFTKWSKAATCIRQNTEIIAEYSRNSYTVNFYNYDGSLINSQKVLHEDSAKAPSYSAPTGYSFIAWDTDFSKITCDTDVKATIQWTSAYPLEISTTSNIYRNGKTYITTAIVNNSPNSVSNAKVIVALKTSENKELAEVSSNNISLAAGEVKNVTLSVDYDKGAATYGDIFVVKANSENIPLANRLSVKVDQGTAWSQWSTSQSPSSALETQSRTEYSKRTKSYTTSSNGSLGDGWVKYNTTSAYTDWSGWSSWQDSYIGSSDLVDVKTQTVQDTSKYTDWGSWSGWQDSYVASSDLKDVRTQSVPASYKTVYHYYYYTKTNSEKDGNTSYYKNSNYPYGPWTVTFDSSLPTTTGGTSVPVTKYQWSNHHGTGKYMYVYADDPYTTQEVTSYKTQYSYRTRSYGTKTQYSKRTRSLNYTYYYYKWSGWSDWVTTVLSSNSDTEVQTRTTYRYISNIPENVEDKSGTLRTISGTIGSQFANKFAILSVVDSKGSTQFIGQTKISVDGKYSYSFKLKSEPTESSGDYKVLLSIEGSTSAIELNPILAPVPRYTVTFRNSDGTILKTETVKKGESATSPVAPERTGYDFIGWDKTPVNVQSDLVVTAQFKKKVFDIVFVDEVKSTTETIQFEYGAILTTPEMVELPEAYNFKGWDAILNGITTVDDNMVVNAIYEKKIFDITFLGYEDEILGDYTVEYGDGITPPELAKDDIHVFIGWDTDINFDNVTEGGTIQPVYEYTKTVATPTASILDGEFSSSQTVSLTCETAGAKIYYTTDGSDPLEQITTSKSAKLFAKSVASDNYAGTLYTGPFTIDESSVLIFAAVKDNMNSSCYEEKNYAIDTNGNTKHLITIHYGIDSIEYSYLSETNSLVNLFMDGAYEIGYTFVGAYKDPSFINEWDLEKDLITAKTDIYLKWQKNTYKVTFVGKDDEILSEQTVDYLDSADAPMIPEYNGYTFSGWDNEYDEIYCDLMVKATYIKNDDLTRLELSDDALTLGTKQPAAKLSVNTLLATDSKNTHVIWESSDESIATVDEEGTVTAISNGSATIYAISDDSGISDECEVTVLLECKHDYIALVTAPTCTEKGYTTYTCTVCKDSYIGDYVDTIAHKFVVTKTVPASCIEEGAIVSTCSECKKTQTEKVPKTDHFDNNGDGKCDTCGKDLGTVPTEPTDPSATCNHMCHKAGFMGFLWKIVNIFNKLFKINKTCSCGAAHY